MDIALTSIVYIGTILIPIHGLIWIANRNERIRIARLTLIHIESKLGRYRRH